MLDSITAAVDTWAFAVPNSKNAVVFSAGPQIHLLRTPNRCHGQILIQAGLEFNMTTRKEARSLPEGGIISAQGRTTIAGDEAGSIQPCRYVPLTLQHR